MQGHIRQEDFDIVNNMFLNIFHHSHPKDSLLTYKRKNACDKILQQIKNQGFSNLTSLFLSNGTPKKKSTLLMVYMIAETIEAIVEERYPLEVVSFRKVIVETLEKAGYDIAFDSNTSGIFGDEAAIFTINAFDKILNSPVDFAIYPDQYKEFFQKYGRKPPMTSTVKKMRNELYHTTEVTCADFLKMLKVVRAKRKVNKKHR